MFDIVSYVTGFAVGWITGYFARGEMDKEEKEEKEKDEKDRHG